MHHHSAEVQQGRMRLTCQEVFKKGMAGNRMWNLRGAELKSTAHKLAMHQSEKELAEAAKNTTASASSSSTGQTVPEALEQIAKEKRVAAAQKRKPTCTQVANKRLVIAIG